MSRASRSPISRACATRGADVSRYIGSHPHGRARARRTHVGAAPTSSSVARGSSRRTTASPTRRARRHRRPHPRPRRDARRDDARASTTAASRSSRTCRRSSSSLMARRLIDAPHASVNLAGQGLRDVTRIAASDPELWVQILGANAAPVARDPARGYRDDLDRFIDALDDPDAPGARRRVAEELAGGNTGVERLPGKHGIDRASRAVVVMVDDRPGELARLLHRDRRDRRQHRGPAARALARRAGRARRDLRAARGAQTPHRRAGRTRLADCRLNVSRRHPRSSSPSTARPAAASRASRRRSPAARLRLPRHRRRVPRARLARSRHPASTPTTRHPSSRASPSFDYRIGTDPTGYAVHVGDDRRDRRRSATRGSRRS